MVLPSGGPAELHGFDIPWPPEYNPDNDDYTTDEGPSDAEDE